MNHLLAVALGGALGAGSRHLVNMAALKFLGSSFPWGTLTVNVAGCFLMGVLVEALALKFQASQEVRLFLATGVLGGFTTFSAFSLDVVLLVERKESLTAALYVMGSVGLSIGALFLALHLTRAVLV
ncbi:MAG: fluoride efflux transporter CrcB [Rhizobiales bacterium]|nr:fluoride efflux transporter CrcB [Hyphomicrobiales bacterium]